MNILDYIKWRGDLSFKVSPFNEVDSLILANVAYINWQGILENKVLLLNKAWKKYCTIHQDTLFKNEDSLNNEREKMLQMMADSKRFGRIILVNYVKEISLEDEKQFSAITLQLPDRSLYVAYEGTDNSLVGWKENFNMSFMDHVPAQTRAAQYLKDISNSVFFTKIHVGGHSKGGNLAVYAAAKINKPEQIIGVYNFDGPGFNQNFIDSEEYNTILPKLVTFRPQSSLIGRIMNNTSKVEIIKSNTKDIAWQHSVYTWEIDVTRMVRAEETTESKFFKDTIDSYYNDLTIEQKQFFIDTFYETLVEQSIVTFDDVLKNKRAVIKAYVTKSLSLTEKERTITFSVLSLMLRSSLNSFKKVYIDTMINKEN